MSSLSKRRYLMTMLVAILEGATVAGLDKSAHREWTAAAIATAIGVSALLCSILISHSTKDAVQGKFPKVPPPPSWTASLVLTAIASLILGAILVVDASQSSGARVATGFGLGLLLLFVSSFLTIGCYHLWKDVPRE
jgi:hypothetical protein